MHSEVLSRDLERHGAWPLEHYLDLWQRWPDLRLGRRLLVVLFVKYQLGEGHGAWPDPAILASSWRSRAITLTVWSATSSPQATAPSAPATKPARQRPGRRVRREL